MSLLAPLNPRIDTWAGRRVWVVGASSGIGAELARALHRRGARVAVSARRREALQALFESAPDGQPSAALQVLPLDVNDSAAVSAAAATLQASWGGIDLVLWVAGIYQPMRAQNFELDRARAMLQTNLVAVYSALDAVLPMLLTQGRGAIALVSSVAGYSGLPQSLAYGPTKAALINLAETLYLDLHPLGIGVHLINPGFVDTPATAGNTFPMPALITAQDAAEATLAGLEAGRFEIHFPARFTLWLKFARILPYRLYFGLIRRITGG
jgi:NAD(P)-dependent dehydrogenase (short-subunit alcohol dehydrogenase family)